MKSAVVKLRKRGAEAIALISEYMRIKEDLYEILSAYNVSSPEELLERIKSGELPEHPTYEDYLEAKSLLEDLKEIRKRMIEVIERL